MEEYKLYVEDTGGKLIDKDKFEANTVRREPWYLYGSGDKLSQLLRKSGSLNNDVVFNKFP